MEHKAWAADASSTAAWPPPGSGAKEMPPRAPQYPLKTARQVFTEAEIAQARANLAKYPAAKAVSEEIVKAAAPWLEWDDSDLLRLLTPASIPRAFDLNSSVGCPKCGKEIYKFGTYPWIVDPKKPFKLTCPVDGTVYPTNDYETYYRSGFQEKIGWDTPHVDDGWGWLSPSGERHWFVAHANHQTWKDFIGPGVMNLAHSYTLTGDRRAAHKAAVMLYRLAQVYPAMDYEHQSRYGLMMAAQGGRYLGKVLNNIWETNFAADFADAYDEVWETMEADAALQTLSGKSSAELRGFIEANFLEDAIDAYYAGKIRGNFGMHQLTMCYLALARQYGDQDKWLGGLLNETGGSSPYLGINYALYDLIYREGIPSETSPGYNFLWVACLTSVAGLLQKSGRDLFKQPRMRLLYDGVLDVINTRKFTPDLGDTGTVYGGMEGKSADVFQAAYRVYQDKRYADFLASFGATGNAGYQTFQSLFLPPMEADSSALPALPPRLLDAYGLGMLNNRQDTISTAITYGLKAGHGHYDRLNFEMFGAGQPIMPDLGYPDAMNDFVPGIFTWSKNTISHNTVVVDASRQTGNVHGTVRLFASSPFARVLDVDAARTYPQAAAYRRAMLMVDMSDNHSYYLDIFHVAGGKQHDYSLHGPPGEFTMQGGDWSDPALGTLAGENVALGEIYDDPVMAKPGYKGGYSAYTGSGFQHLFHVQTCKGGDWAAYWRHEKDASARLCIRILPQPGQQIIMADAHVSPVKYPQIVKYLIARRTGANLTSRFVSVLEPYQNDPAITSVEAIALEEGGGVAVSVQRTDGMMDILAYDADQSAKHLKVGGVEIATDAHAAVVTLNKTSQVRRVFWTGGTFLRAAGREYHAAQTTGKVISVAPEQRTLRIHPAQPIPIDPAALVGQNFSVESGARRVWHQIAAARRAENDLVLITRDDLRIARVPVREIGNGSAALTSAVSLPLGSTYVGASITGSDYRAYHRVTGVSDTTISLESPLPPGSSIAAGQDAWIIDVSPGDQIALPAISSHAVEDPAAS